MIVKSEQKFIRVSPSKIRLVVSAIKGIKEPDRAISILELMGKSASKTVIKSLKTAVANAKNNFNILPQNLKIFDIQVNEGPRYKRYQPVARGMARPILKRTSHVRVLLESKEKTEEEGKSKILGSIKKDKKIDEKKGGKAKKAPSHGSKS